MIRKSRPPKLSLFPLTAELDGRGHLLIGGCSTVELAGQYGTPLYVFDEDTIRARCREFQNEFGRRYPDINVLYASKAFCNRSLAILLKEEGLGLDVVSGGEIALAQSVAFPPDRVYFHGNNKSADELKMALDWGIGRIVVDNLYELDLLNKLAGEKGKRQEIMLRVTPGVDPHTHRYTTTGTLDSKFGFPLTTGLAERALSRALSAENLSLTGLHFHLGSPIPDTHPYEMAIELVLKFAREMQDKYNFNLKEFSPGGGFGVNYTVNSAMPVIADYAEAITSRLTSTTREAGLAPPRCVIEPGRAIVAQAGVALYTAGSTKDIPGVRTYVCVDGGMGDNIRPALYEARYEALLANRARDEETDRVTIAGRYCESGDILAKDIYLPPVSAGDTIAMPASGAYSIPMSSNYNNVPRPAIIMVKDGRSHLIRRRETYQDLMNLEPV